MSFSSAKPVKFEFMFRDGKAQRSRDLPSQDAQVLILKFLDHAAAGADQMVVRQVGRGGIKPGVAVAERAQARGRGAGAARAAWRAIQAAKRGADAPPQSADLWDRRPRGSLPLHLGDRPDSRPAPPGLGERDD